MGVSSNVVALRLLIPLRSKPAITDYRRSWIASTEAPRLAPHSTPINDYDRTFDESDRIAPPRWPNVVAHGTR